MKCRRFIKINQSRTERKSRVLGFLGIYEQRKFPRRFLWVGCWVEIIRPKVRNSGLGKSSQGFIFTINKQLLVDRERERERIGYFFWSACFILNQGFICLTQRKVNEPTLVQILKIHSFPRLCRRLWTWGKWAQFRPRARFFPVCKHNNLFIHCWPGYKAEHPFHLVLVTI